MAKASGKTLLLALAFCAAVAITLFFGYRAGHTVRHIRWQEESIQPWMSVPFIAHTRHTRETVLFEAIHVPPNPRDRRPIRDIARAEQVPVTSLIRDLESAIVKAKEAGAPNTQDQPKR